MDAIAAREEIEKRNQMKLIEPLELDPREIPPECLVDTTVAKDWRYRQGAPCWIANEGKHFIYSKCLPNE